MKVVFFIAFLSVIIHAEELKPNQVQVQENKAKDLIHILTFDTEGIDKNNNAIREKRQFGLYRGDSSRGYQGRFDRRQQGGYGGGNQGGYGGGHQRGYGGGHQTGGRKSNQDAFGIGHLFSFSGGTVG